MTSRLSGFLLLLPAITPIAAQTPFDPPGKTLVEGQAVVPITTDQGGRPAVEVMINGKGPYRMGIDWGANIVAVSERAAKDLSLTPVRQLDAGHGPQPIYRLDHLQIGSAGFDQVHVFMGGFLDRSIDGVLGFNLFADLICTFDFPASQLKLELGALPPANGRDILPLIPNDTGRLIVFGGWHPGEPRPRDYFGDHSTTSPEVAQPSIGLSINGVGYSAVLDTRSSSWLTLPDSIQSRFHLLGHSVQAVGMGPQAGTVALTRTRILDPVTIGGQRIEHIPVSFRNRPGPLLGMGFLRNFVLSLDQRSGRVRLTRGDPGPLMAAADSWPADSAQASATPTLVADPAQYTGLYGHRRITADSGQLYLQRTDPPPGVTDNRRIIGPRLRMLVQGPDRFGLEGIPEAVVEFDRDSAGRVIRLRVRQADGTWQSAPRSQGDQ